MRPLALLTLAVLFSGCAVGPNYHRPTVQAPPQYRGVDDPNQPAIPASLSDTKWFDLFKDEQLTVLVNGALARNYDLRIASARVLEARAQYGIQRADLFPTLGGDAQFNAARISSIGTVLVPRGTDLAESYTQVGFTLGWEIDVWGRIRRLNESARAQYLSTEDARRGVITTLFSDVTTAYFELREADMELEIARQTRDIAEHSLKLTTLRRDRGVATSLDVHQAEQFLYTATATIASAKRQVEQGENLLSFLIGDSPGPIVRGKSLNDFSTPPAVPAGLPSELLARRPDIRQAEEVLISANADIGAAEALYFPKITLTAFLGGQSRALSALFTGPARQWTITPDAAFPIFNAGRIRNQVRYSKAEKQEMIVSYEKAIQNAFREVSDSLVGYRRLSEQRAQQELLVKALRDTDRLSTLRYRGGLDSYLQVLDAERNLFQGELDLARLKRDELDSIVALYRALGGGWQ